MRIIKKKTLVDYYTKVPQSKDALEDWYIKASKAVWTCYADIKKTSTLLTVLEINIMCSTSKVIVTDWWLS